MQKIDMEIKLNKFGKKFFRRHVGCSIVYAEKLDGTTCPSPNCERPDIFAYRPYSCLSWVGEIKTSRADCKNEYKKKHFISGDSMGDFRYMLSFDGVLKEEDIPEEYGWVEFSDDGKYTIKKKPVYRTITAVGLKSERTLFATKIRVAEIELKKRKK